MNSLDSTRIGSMTAEFDGQTLTLVPPTGECNLVSLSMNQVYELYEFVSKFNRDKNCKRMAFRVPLFDSSLLSVQATFGLKILDVTPINISMTGVLVSVSDPVPNIALGDQVNLAMTGQKNSLRLAGEIRSIRDRFVGIFFVDSVDGRELNPPPALSAMIMNLQREWLASRASR